MPEDHGQSSTERRIKALLIELECICAVPLWKKVCQVQWVLVVGECTSETIEDPLTQKATRQIDV